MSARARVWSSVIATGAVAAIVGGAWAVGSGIGSAPAPTPTEAVYDGPVVYYVTPGDVPLTDAEREAIAAAEAQRAAEEAEAARIEAERVAAEQAAAEQAARDAQANQGGGGGGGEPAAPAGPVRCPAGSTATESDGTNDLACLPDVCFTIAVPDPAHPECDRSFRP